MTPQRQFQKGATMENAPQAIDSQPNGMKGVPAEGLDHIFDSSLSSDVSDKPRKKIIELPIQQAAQSLGISERTLWRRIEDGEIKSRMVGNKRVVRVPMDSATLPRDNDMTVPQKQIGTVVDLQKIVQELNGANYRIGYLQGQLEIKNEQLRLLPDLQEASREVHILKAQLAAAEAELSVLRKPWWRRFLGLD
jgi:excisionase family DNA binding protein